MTGLVFYGRRLTTGLRPTDHPSLVIESKDVVLGALGAAAALAGLVLVLWRAKAKHAYNATRAFIREIRPDDVTSLLIAELEVAPEFRTYLAKKKLNQKYWYSWFAELIIDRFWTELAGG